MVKELFFIEDISKILYLACVGKRHQEYLQVSEVYLLVADEK